MYNLSESTCSMGSSLHILTILLLDFGSLWIYLGILYTSHGNSFLLGQRFGPTSQQERSLICSSILCNVGTVLCNEPNFRLSY